MYSQRTSTIVSQSQEAMLVEENYTLESGSEDYTSERENYTSESGDNPSEALHQSLLDGDGISVIENLLADGASLDALNEERETVLEAAISNSGIEVVEYLIKRTEDLNCFKNNPLHYAALQDKPKIISLLLANGADINRKNEWGCSPLITALIHGSYKAAFCLIENGAEYCDIPQRKDAVNFLFGAVIQFVTDQCPPIDKNSSVRSAEMIRFLIALGIERFKPSLFKIGDDVDIFRSGDFYSVKQSIFDYTKICPSLATHLKTDLEIELDKYICNPESRSFLENIFYLSYQFDGEILINGTFVQIAKFIYEHFDFMFEQEQYSQLQNVLQAEYKDHIANLRHKWAEPRYDDSNAPKINLSEDKLSIQKVERLCYGLVKITQMIAMQHLKETGNLDIKVKYFSPAEKTAFLKPRNNLSQQSLVGMFANHNMKRGHNAVSNGREQIAEEPLEKRQKR